MKIGVLLVNVGSPKSPTTKDVRLYLKEFLWDKRVIDISAPLRFLLLMLIILPFRSKKSAQLYKNIWTQTESPLIVYSNAFAKKLQQSLGEKYDVQIGMRYGEPSLKIASDYFQKNMVEKIIFAPMYPQYSVAATATAVEYFSKQITKNWAVIPFSTIPPFFRESFFIQAQKSVLQKCLEQFNPDHVLFSYHGIPERHISKLNLSSNVLCLKSAHCCEQLTNSNYYCYRAQCFETSRLIAKACSLNKDFYSVSFQSRLGRTKWIKPYTDLYLKNLYAQGVRKLLVACPAFVADCLETIEEITFRLKDSWVTLGGTELNLVPSLNDNDDWVAGFAQMIESKHAVNRLS